MELEISPAMIGVIMLATAVLLALIFFSYLGYISSIKTEKVCGFSIVAASFDGQYAQIYLMNTGCNKHLFGIDAFVVFIDDEKCDVVFTDKELEWAEGTIKTLKVRSTADPATSHQIKVFIVGDPTPACYTYQGKK